jgi:hypothetical protein
LRGRGFRIGYPCGSSVLEKHLGTVDEFEERKRAELEHRAAALPDDLKRHATLETRQFDFKARSVSVCF